MSSVKNNLVQAYLDQVHKKLPEWLKWKSNEVEDILNDLEFQIMNQAQIIAGGDEPSDSNIQEAINQMGSPESIARPYKNRGTPKFYLTQELFEFYLRTLFAFFGIIILINIVIAIFKFVAAIILPTISIWEALGSMFGGIWIGCLIAAVVISIVFVYFSMEGFLPEDFGTIPRRLALIFPFNLTEEQVEENRLYTQQKLEEARILREQKFAEAKAVKADMAAEARIVRETKMAEATLKARDKIAEAKQKVAEAKELAKLKAEETKAIKALKTKDPVSVGDLVFGAAAGVIFGLFLIIQPFVDLAGVLFDPAFLDWLKIFGLLVFISGLFSLIRLAIGVRNHTGQQVMLILLMLYNIVYIPMFLYLLNNPQIFPISLVTGGIVDALVVGSLAFTIYFWVLVIIVIAQIIDMIDKLNKVARLQKIKREY
ncbi:MAG: hypothetical protein EU533_03725 [Promethearchaeota archaeon]|nr:MAG: hypothetical protein EU533_03725 [Candidatus Lokiarchaeota archaeon]